MGSANTRNALMDNCRAQRYDPENHSDPGSTPMTRSALLSRTACSIEVALVAASSGPASSRATSYRPAVTRRASVLLMALLGGLVGCGGDARPGGVDGETVEAEMTEIFRVGIVDGDGWEAFANIRSLAFDAEGNLYILDVGQHHVVVLDPQGELIRTFGSRGEGPGELRSPMNLTVLGSGEVAIFDMGHQAFQLFSPEGRHLRNHPSRLDEGFPGMRTYPHGERGVVSISGRIVMAQPGAGAETPTTAPIRRWELSDEGGAEVIHEAWLPPPAEGGGPSVGGIRFPAARAFTPVARMAVLPDGDLLVADSTPYRIARIGADGSHRETLGRDILPIPVTDRVRAVERERRLAAVEAGGGPQISVVVQGSERGSPTIGPDQITEMQRDQIRNLTFWPELSVIRDLAADRSGRIWVARSAGVEEPGPVDVLAADGELLRSFTPDFGPLPGAFGPDDRAAWVETDEFDVPFVVVRRVEGLPRP